MAASAIAIGLIFLLILLLPVGAGIVLIVLSRRRGKGFPACGKCGYNVSGTLGTANTRCPECGSEFATVGIMPATSRRSAALLWSGLAMIILPLTCLGFFWFSRLALERQAMTRAQAARATAQAATTRAASASSQTPISATQPTPVDASAPGELSEEVRQVLEHPLTQSQINAMSEGELRQALASVSKARYVAHPDATTEARLKNEFVMLMERMRELKESP